MRVTNQSVQQVMTSASIEDVVGEFVTLKRAGRNMVARCPFHEEKSPSFNVSPERNIYKCFGCGKGGDSATFLQELEGLTFVEALEWLARRYNIVLEYEQAATPEAEQRTAEREQLLKVLAWAAAWFRIQLTDTENGKAIAGSYLKERGVLPATAETFGLGWAPDSWDALTNAALAAGFTAAQLEGAGLATTFEDGRLAARFRARVMFPIYAPAGRIVAFGGRALHKDAKTAKYINSPETLVYSKSEQVYGLWQGRQAIRKQEHVFLTEGYLDVIALHQAGVERAVASSGTALSEAQARLLLRYAPNITVLFDADAAGQKAALKGIDTLLEAGMAVRALSLPAGHDPDSFIKAHGSQAFTDLAQTAQQDFVTYKTQALAKDAGTDPYLRAAMISEVVRTISLVESPIARSVFFKQCAALVGVEEQTLITESNRLTRARAEQKEKERQRNERNSRASDTNAQDVNSDFNPVSGYALGPDGITEHDYGQHDFGNTDHANAPNSQVADGHQGAVGALVAGELALSPAAQLALQERECLRLLLNYGTDAVSEEPPMPLLHYLMQELDELTFETPIVQQAFAFARKQSAEGALAGPAEFLQHPDFAIRRLAQDLLILPHSLSPEWAKREIFVREEGESTGHMAYHHLLRLKHRALIGKEEKLLHELRALDAPDKAEAQRAVLLAYMELKKLEAMLAAELGQVVMK
jgi:DNA primase